MKYSKKIKKKHSSDKPNSCDKMSEESLAELIEGLIFVLGKEAKRRNIEIHDTEAVNYIDIVTKEFEKEKGKNVELEPIKAEVTRSPVETKDISEKEVVEKFDNSEPQPEASKPESEQN